MFAVIKTGGRQYRVVPDDVLEIGKIAGDVGTIVQLGEVLLVGGESPVLGAGELARVLEEATVLDATCAPEETLAEALARLCRDAGATALVAGTAVFRGGPSAYADNIRALRGL